MANHLNDGIEQLARSAGEKFAELVRIMARLRAPGGCPWDRKQTFDSIKPYTLEETYEVMDAIDARDWPALTEELGDLMLQPVFYAEIARDAGLFDVAQSLEAINGKLIRRHPHVFAGAQAETPEEVLTRWNEIKKQEKQGRESEKLLDAVPRSLPALVEAEKISSKAAGVGFEWPSIDGVVEKLQEEVKELAKAQNAAEIAHEIGDLLFTLVNVARFLKVDPEQALRGTNARFRRRFAYVEDATESFANTSLDEMERLWQEAKRLETDYNREK